MGEVAFIGIGSNLGDRLNYLREGVEGVVSSAEVHLLAASSIFASEPLGTVEQPVYLNAVFSVITTLGPEALLGHMRSIEDAHRRQRAVHWGPRTLDLDLLLHGDQQIHNDELNLPHPFLLERCFVLVPLCEIASEHRHPTTGRPLSEHLLELECTTALEPFGEGSLSSAP